MTANGCSERGGLTELASGVDALYLSGRADLSPALLAVLEERRQAAEAAEDPVAFEVAGVEWWVEPRSFGRYRYRLTHPHGLVGITTSDNLPTFRVQPRAEFLHGVGPQAVLAWFDGFGEYLAGGPVYWTLSRLDLFCDVQGWQLEGDDRHRFVCRAKRRDLHEEGEAFTGFEFGRRTTKTVCARLYDKTLQVHTKGLDWWPSIWGNRYDPSKPVLRVEVEVGRQGLVEYGINSPTDGLERAAGVWASVTSDWLTYRTATADDTRSRWPVAPEWADVQRATLRGQAVGFDRVRALRRKGQLRKLMPTLVGYAAGVGALLGTEDLHSTMAAVGHLITEDEVRRGVMFPDRIAARAAEESRR